MIPEIRAVNRDGVPGEILPDWKTLNYLDPDNETGQVTVEYPTTGRRYDLITPRREFALFVDGVELPNGRFQLQETDGNWIADGTPVVRWTGPTLMDRFDEGLVVPRHDPHAEEDVLTRAERRYKAKVDNYEARMRRYNRRLKEWRRHGEHGDKPKEPKRGYKVDNKLEKGLDGAPPPNAPVFKNDTPGQVIRYLFFLAKDRGALDEISVGFTPDRDSAGKKWDTRITQRWDVGTSIYEVMRWMVENRKAEFRMRGRRLNAYNPGTGVDRNNPHVLLARGKNLMDGPVQASGKDMATSVLCLSDAGVHGWVRDRDLVRDSGRIEAKIQAQGIRKWDELESQGEAYLRFNGHPRYSYTYGIVPGHGADPYVNYQTGDWIYVLDGEATTRRRVRQIGLSWDENRDAKIAVTVNDLLTERELSHVQVVNAIRGRSVNTPHGGGNSNGRSPREEADGVAPKKPNAPAVAQRAGIIRISDDGLDADGEDVTWDQSHIEVHIVEDPATEITSKALGDTKAPGDTLVRTVDTVDLDVSTLYDVIPTMGVSTLPDLPYDQQMWVRFVAVDSGGDRSEASDPVPVTPLKVTEADLDVVLPPGEQGDPGPSAYEIAVANGFVGTEEEWVASLKGDPGDPGDPGEPGPPGDPAPPPPSPTDSPIPIPSPGPASVVVNYGAIEGQVADLYVWTPPDLAAGETDYATPAAAPTAADRLINEFPPGGFVYVGQTGSPLPVDRPVWVALWGRNETGAAPAPSAWVQTSVGQIRPENLELLVGSLIASRLQAETLTGVTITGSVLDITGALQARPGFVSILGASVFEANSGTFHDALTIQGLLNRLQGTMELTAVVQPPTSQVTVQPAGWDTVTLASTLTSWDAGLTDTPDGLSWVVVHSPGAINEDAEFRTRLKSTGANAAHNGANLDANNNLTPDGGICRIGNEFFVLGSNFAAGGNYEVWVYDATTFAKTRVVPMSGFAPANIPAIGAVGGTLFLVWVTGAGTMKLRKINPATGAQIGVDIVLSAGPLPAVAVYGVAPSNAAETEFVVKVGAYNPITSKLDGSRVNGPKGDFTAPTLGGFFWDGTRLWSQNGDKTITKFAKWQGGTIRSAYTQVDDDASPPNGTAETTLGSIMSTDAASRFQKIAFTTPAPDDDGTVDGANTVAVYASETVNAVTAPLKKVAQFAEGVRTMIFDDLVTTTDPPPANGFATRSSANPGRLKSGAGGATPIIDLLGTGSGRVGPLSWDNSGKGIKFPVPVSTMLDFAGTADKIPTDFLPCDGRSVLRADFPTLFEFIGTTYGAADATHFNIPDKRGRHSIGLNADAVLYGKVLGTTETGSADTGGAVAADLVVREERLDHIHKHVIDPTVLTQATNTTSTGTANRLTGPSSHDHGGNTGTKGVSDRSRANHAFLTVNVIIKAVR